jgi:hypothetical protein
VKADGRAFALVELLERSKKPEESGYQQEPMEEGDFESEAPMHCDKGLRMARAFLEQEENAASPLRPKVEALASAYEDLLSALESAEG